MDKYIKLSHTEYLKSNSWKCDKSPTGAHHWTAGDSDIFRCKYCKQKRVFIQQHAAVIRKKEHRGYYIEIDNPDLAG